jgi:hypothetical protein
VSKQADGDPHVAKEGRAEGLRDEATAVERPCEGPDSNTARRGVPQSAAGSRRLAAVVDHNAGSRRAHTYAANMPS